MLTETYFLLIEIQEESFLCGLPSFVNSFNRKIKEKASKRKINQVQEIKDGIFIPLIRTMK